MQELNICEKFHCLAKECPISCCKGWQIPVDDDTIKAYRRTGGLKGRMLRAHVVMKKPYRIRRILGRCPFHNSDGLCQHQQNGELEYMPSVCKVFPRRSMDFGDYREVTMELSCPSAARVFLENLGRLHFINKDYEIDTLWELENDDKDFLRFLRNDRDKLLDYLWTDGLDIPSIWQTLYAYVYNEHELIISDRFNEIDTIEITSDKLKQGDYAIMKDPSYSFFSIKTVDRMLLEHIDYGVLILRMPRFYKLIRRYLHYFNKLTPSEANIFFDNGIRKMIESYPEFEIKYKSYFSYNIQQLYMIAYENYFILREYLLALLYTQLLMLFDLIEFLDKGKISVERQTMILSWAEHGIRHNPSLTTNLYNVIREEFL